MKIDNIEFRMEDAPAIPRGRPVALPEEFGTTAITENTSIETPDMPTPEQLLMWSSAEHGAS